MDLYFDGTDFACALAPQAGRLKEYKIDEVEVECEVPVIDPETSAIIYPYELDLLGEKQFYTCGILSGKYQAIIPGYEDGKQQTVMCNPYEHTKFEIEFP